MNRTALRQALTARSFLITVTFSVTVVTLVALSVANPLLLLIEAAPLYAAVLAIAGGIEYHDAKARLERDAARAEFDVLVADHRARLAAVQATGVDPGPSDTVRSILALNDATQRDA